MLRKIKLYGELAEFVGHKEFEVQVDSLQKAVSFLVNNFPQVEAYMNPKYYQVKVGNYAIDESEIHHPIGKEDIHFVPVIAGAGRFGKILLGAALIGIGFAVGGGLFGSALAKNLGAISFVKKVGFALVLQGVSDLLFPLPQPPKFESEEDPRLSFSFSGTQNTARAGTPVPIVYGEIMTGSVVISTSLDTQQVQA
jgi:predicted phage tail protein|nr:phage tail assembly protein [uncultured Mediterranean phage uvMED]BAR21876.1 phage tail assembly protein [uncultured Mediterranean phage uvMED]